MIPIPDPDLPADVEREPTVAELAAIEAEWPLIEAELTLLDAEIIILTAPGGPAPIDWVRLRRAQARVLHQALALRRAATGDRRRAVA
jgi:uncharacterized protein DUF6284